MLKLIAPAGTPIYFRDMVGIALSQLHIGVSQASFEECILSLTGASKCLFFNSGRTALVFILRALSKLSKSEKNEVVIPAYTCYSVASAIARTGLKIRLVDVDPRTLDYDYANLKGVSFGNVLAVLSCNLFGVVSEWSQLGTIARENGIFAIDDAAQTMGCESDGKASGSFGDIAFFSFGRGKNLSTYSGGAAVTSNLIIAEQLHHESENLRKTGFLSELNSAARIILYGLFLRPHLYWFPNALPFLNLGETVFDISFELDSYTWIQRCAGGILYPRLSEINAIRKENARKMAQALLKADGFYIPRYSEENLIPYLRLPVLVPNREERDRLLRNLRKVNVIASTMYPSTIRQIPDIEKYLASDKVAFPGAEELVNRLLCLPTHPYLRDRDIENIISCITGDGAR